MKITRARRILVITSLLLAIGAALLLAADEGSPSDVDHIVLTREWVLARCADTGGSLDAAAPMIAVRLEGWGVACSVAVEAGEIVVKTAAVPESDLGLLGEVMTHAGGVSLHDVDVPAMERPASPGAEFVRPEPVLTGEELVLRPGAAALVTHEEWGSSVIVQTSPDDRARLGAFTEARVGRPVALVVDGEIMTTPVVRQRIEGDIAVQPGDPDLDLRAVAAFASSPPLEVCLGIAARGEIHEIMRIPPPPPPTEPVIDPVAVGLLEQRLLGSGCGIRSAPERAEIRFRSGRLLDPRAVVSYRWESPGMECASATLSCVRAYEALAGFAEAGMPIPIDFAIEHFESSEDLLLSQIKGAGRLALGLDPPYAGGSPLVAALQEGLPSANEIDVLFESHAGDSTLILRGVAHGRFEGEEFHVFWPRGSACPDWYVTIGTGLEMRVTARWKTEGDVTLPDEMEIVSEAEGVRSHERMRIEYRRVGSHWITERVTIRPAEGPDVSLLELVDVDVESGARDCRDEIVWVDADSLAGIAERNQMKMLEQARRNIEQLRRLNPDPEDLDPDSVRAIESPDAR